MATAPEKPITTTMGNAAKAPVPTQVAPLAIAKVAEKVTRKPAAKRPNSTAKAAVKPVVKTPGKSLVKTVINTATKPVTTQKTEKPAKEKKPKLVRDSFTIPKTEYAVLDELKQRTGKLAVAAKKSELIRAGIKALATMSDPAFLAALKAVPAIKTGRPKK